MSGSLRVLIAEDEYLCLMGIRSSLRSLGHRVIAEASNGRHAVDQALEKKPDLIIMDINMDDMDGIEAIRRVNEQMLIPSIIVTGYCEDDLVKRATNAGVFAYLVKPVDADDLKSAIEVAMARFEELKQLKEELQGLEQALEARKYVERAKGILMDRQNLREAEAMRRLQEMSMKSNKRMVEVAKEIIDADSCLERDPAEPPAETSRQVRCRPVCAERRILSAVRRRSKQCSDYPTYAYGCPVRLPRGYGSSSSTVYSVTSRYPSDLPRLTEASLAASHGTSLPSSLQRAI